MTGAFAPNMTPPPQSRAAAQFLNPREDRRELPPATCPATERHAYRCDQKRAV